MASAVPAENKVLGRVPADSGKIIIGGVADENCGGSASSAPPAGAEVAKTLHATPVVQGVFQG